jgi:hypothetical protein
LLTWSSRGGRCRKELLRLQRELLAEVDGRVVGSHPLERDQAGDDDISDLGVYVVPVGGQVLLAGVGAAGADDGLGGLARLLGELEDLERPLLVRVEAQPAVVVVEMACERLDGPPDGKVHRDRSP